MFLDIKGTIKAKSPGYEANIVKDAIIDMLRSARAKITIKESDEIRWKGPYFAWSWESTAFVLHMLEGKLHIKQMEDGGVEVDYCVSLHWFHIMYLVFLLFYILLHFLTKMPIEMLFIFLGIFSLMHASHYLWVKLWLKGFIKRHIHSLD